MEQEPIVIIYDGDCGLCRGSVEWLKKRDRNSIFLYEALQDPEVLFRYEIPFQEAAAEMQAIIGGMRYSGAEAVIRSLAQLPGYGWLRFAIQFPPFLILARFMYREIAKRRR